MMGYYRSPPGSVAVDASKCSKQLSEQATLMPANIKSNTVGEGGGQKWMINQTGSAQLEMMKQMDPNFFMLFSLAAKKQASTTVINDAGECLCCSRLGVIH